MSQNEPKRMKKNEKRMKMSQNEPKGIFIHYLIRKIQYL